MTEAPDLTFSLLPPGTYFPHPALVPAGLGMNGVKPVPMSVLLRLGACSDGGPDSVACAIEPSEDLSTDPESPPPVVGGLNIIRSAQLGDDGRRTVVAWFASVTGLTFRADAEDRVYVDGPEGPVVLHDGKAWAKRRGTPYRPTVWAREQKFDRGPVDLKSPDHAELAQSLRYGYKGAGKSKRYDGYAAMVEARNARLLRPSHGIAPDAIGPLLGVTPMIGGFDKTHKVVGKPRTELVGLETRRIGTTYEVSMSDAWANRAHGERPGSKQAVLRYDSPVIATADTIDLAAMQVLKGHDTETLLVIVGLLMTAYDTNNRPQRIGASDLASIRGVELNRSSKTKRAYGEMSQLLRDVEFRVRPMSASAEGAEAMLPLFVKQGTIRTRGGKELPMVTVNAMLFDTMWTRGHGILLERRLLEVNLRTDEWAARIGMALSWQWAMGWRMNGYAEGKRLRRSMRQLLLDAGIGYDFDTEQRKRGPASMRQKLAKELDALVRLRLGLQSWKRVKEAATPSDDMYELVPAAQLSDALSTHRRLPVPDRTGV